MKPRNLCVVTGCDKRRGSGLRLCSMHYQRLLHHGDVHKVNKGGGPAKVTPTQWDEIKRLDHNFVAPNEIARRVDLSGATVRKVIKGTYPRPDEAAA